MISQSLLRKEKKREQIKKKKKKKEEGDIGNLRIHHRHQSIAIHLFLNITKKNKERKGRNGYNLEACTFYQAEGTGEIFCYCKIRRMHLNEVSLKQKNLKEKTKSLNNHGKLLIM